MKFTNLLLNLSLIAGLFFATSCSNDDDDDTSNVVPTEERVFNIAAEVSDGDNITTYIATAPDLSTGDLSFVGNGLELNATVAARVIAQGDYIYNLDYGGGIIYQYEVLEDGTYSLVKELDVNIAIGTATPRYKVVDENTIMLHNVVVDTEYEADGTTIKSVTPKMYAVAVQIPELTIRTIMEPTTISQTAESVAESAYGFRVDAPVVSGGKLYYGLMRTIDGIGRGGVPASSGLETIVLDYPSLTNLQVVRSSANTTGHTNGYRAPSMHVDENGDVYQSNQFMSWFGFDLSGGSKTVISRLQNGNYDDSYEFNVSQALGEEVSTAGWFYAGNGIGYMPILLEDVFATGADNFWSVARIDLNNKTAVKLNVPLSSLLSYQSAVTHDDKFYMAISPIGGDAKVYEFDVNSTSADGFKEALDLDDGNIFIQGIY